MRLSPDTLILVCYNFEGEAKMDNNKEIEKVLSKYDVSVIDVKLESYKDKKGVWWINTQSGTKILKKQPNSEKTIEFVISAIDYLTEKGIHIPKIIKNNDGHHYTEADGDYYILSEAIIGKRPNYDNTKELKAIVQGLAKFHSASLGFNPPLDCKPRIHLGNLIKEHEESMIKLESFYSKEKQSDCHNSFGTNILNEFPHFYNRMQNSIIELNKSCYTQWVEKVKNIRCLCHQDFAAGNLVLDKKGELYILDTDSITIDIPIRDIRKLLNKVMKKNGSWDYELARMILEWYQEENPLEVCHWLVLKSELEYPHLFYGAMSKYYEMREKSWTQQKYESRLKEMCEIEKSAEQVISRFESIIP